VTGPENHPILAIKDLHVSFDTPDGEVRAVTGLDFELHQGETLAIVGESGSGKSQTALAIMGLLSENGWATGSVIFADQDLMQLSQEELNEVRGKDISMIFQDPMTSLNPYLTIEKQMAEVVMHHQGLGKDEARAQAVEMLRAVRIADPEERIQDHPHQYSGGMRQRVMIAMGLLCQPQILIADEPTTALDVTVQEQIIHLIAELRQKSSMSIIVITHDLAVVADIADRIVVMYAGQMVERGSARDIFYRPQHPYTKGLLESVPRLDRVDVAKLQAIPGNPPNPVSVPDGCRFRDRCQYAVDACREDPPLQTADGHRASRCIREIDNQELPV
jgi:oligopeptide transport system ATP-binding protein